MLIVKIPLHVFLVKSLRLPDRLSSVSRLHESAKVMKVESLVHLIVDWMSILP